VAGTFPAIRGWRCTLCAQGQPAKHSRAGDHCGVHTQQARWTPLHGTATSLPLATCRKHHHGLLQGSCNVDAMQVVCTEPMSLEVLSRDGRFQLNCGFTCSAPAHLWAGLQKHITGTRARLAENAERDDMVSVTFNCIQLCHRTTVQKPLQLSH
jgi:hypothetical protein